MFNRREFAFLLSGSVTTSMIAKAAGASRIETHPIKAIAFDAFPIFDPRPVFQLAEEIFPGRGAELSNEWKTRQFEYTWLRTLTGQYADFWHVTQDALVYAGAKLGLELDESKTARLMDS